MAKLKPFTMPKWGIEMSEGTLAEWMVAENEQFDKGTVLALIETDKITNEVESETPGRFVRLLAQAGETLPVGALLAVLSDGDEVSAAEVDALIEGFHQADTSFAAEGEEGGTPLAEAATVSTPPAPPIPDNLAISPMARAKAEAAGLDVSAISGSGRGGRITAQDVDQALRGETRPNLRGPLPLTPISGHFATPMARRLAVMHGISLNDVVGSGPRGRIRKADVLPLVGPTAETAGEDEMEILPMSAMRRTIARRLSEAKATIPHFYVRRRVRADRLLALRAALVDEQPTVNDFLVKACAIALMEVPQVNIQVHGTDIHRFARPEIAIAVATEKGLVTPIIRGAHALTLSEIRVATADLVERARAGQLSAEEFTGGSFTLSNLGGFGVEQFDAIINPPQGAILAIGSARPEPIEDDGALRIAPVFHLSLSCDHRAIDGADAGQFLSVLARMIETPTLFD